MKLWEISIIFFNENIMIYKYIKNDINTILLYCNFYTIVYVVIFVIRYNKLNENKLDVLI